MGEMGGNGSGTETVSPVMNSTGDGHYSYDRNSSYQRDTVNLQKGKIDEVIRDKLDLETLTSTSNVIRIVDLGCSIGPNTFISMHNIVEAMKNKYQSDIIVDPSPLKMPEFQVFFNDQSSNDFNTLFTSLPTERPYFATGVPGSFHGRLFPESSIHFAYASSALHWLSKIPEELLNKNSPAWNKGRVQYSNAPMEVVNAYKSQFYKDVTNFLNARAKEIVIGGMVVVIINSIRREHSLSEIFNGYSADLMACVLIDMVKENLIDEDKADSFNLPMYIASPEEMIELITRNGYFSIEMMDTTNPANILNGGPVDVEVLVGHLRAAYEGLLTKHFKCEIDFIDDFFARLYEKYMEGYTRMHDILGNCLQLLVVLKRI